MKLTFLGTRGYIDPRNRRHRRHAALLVAYRGRTVLIDCGEDWIGRVARIGPDAIVLTHGHPDHAFGLRDGAPCPVYATQDTWQAIDAFPVRTRSTIRPREPVRVAGISFEAFAVVHSIRAPAVGYRVRAGRATIFYVPDVVYIPERDEALAGADLYVGDGATVRRSMVRKIKGRLIGHTPLRTQLTWCEKEGVPRALFTHCGAAIVAGDERRLGPLVARMGRERGMNAGIAHDGQEVIL